MSRTRCWVWSASFWYLTFSSNICISSPYGMHSRSPSSLFSPEMLLWDSSLNLLGDAPTPLTHYFLIAGTLSYLDWPYKPLFIADDHRLFEGVEPAPPGYLFVTFEVMLPAAPMVPAILPAAASLVFISFMACLLFWVHCLKRNLKNY